MEEWCTTMNARQFISIILVATILLVSVETRSMSSGRQEYRNDGALNSVPMQNLTFHKHVVASFFHDVCSVQAHDIDADGDTDIVACGFSDEVAWWENEGIQSFSWEKHVIDDTIEGASYVYVSDIDGDIDADVAGVSWYDNRVCWWENTGAPRFSGYGTMSAVTMVILTRFALQVSMGMKTC